MKKLTEKDLVLGAVLVDRDDYKVKIQGICGDIVFLSDSDLTSAQDFMSKKEVLESYTYLQTDSNQFQKGDKVLVKDEDWEDDNWERAYFSRYHEGVYYCFHCGDEWLSESDDVPWDQCKPFAE